MRMREHNSRLEKVACCSFGDEAPQEMMTGTANRDDVAGLHSTSHSHFGLVEVVVAVYLLLTAVVILVSMPRQILVG